MRVLEMAREGANPGRSARGRSPNLSEPSHGDFIPTASGSNLVFATSDVILRR